MIGKHGIEKDEIVNPCEITDAKAMTILCCIELDSFNMKKIVFYHFTVMRQLSCGHRPHKDMVNSNLLCLW